MTTSYARPASDATVMHGKAPANTKICEGFQEYSDEPKRLVAIVIRLERTSLRHTDIVSLLLAQLRQLNPELFQV